MEELRVPWSNKEGVLYGGVIAILTSLIMCTFNSVKTAGELTVDSVVEGLVCVPFVWACVMVLMTFVIGRVADWFVRKYTMPADSFYTKIVFNIIPCVMLTSAIMTLVGPEIGCILGEGALSIDPVYAWPESWAINFFVAFWVEMVFAQPVARSVMKHKHLRMLQGGGGGSAQEAHA